MDMSMDSWVNGAVGATATRTAVLPTAAIDGTCHSDETRKPDVHAHPAATDSSDTSSTRSKDLRDDLPSLSTLKDATWVRKLASSSRKLLTQQHPAAIDSGNASSVERTTRSASTKRRGSAASASPSQSPRKNAQSVLVPAYDDDILATLDPRFFTESFDAVAHLLDILPTSRDELDAFLRTEISAVDVARDVIVAKLADDVRANQDVFIQGMKQVQEVDLDLVRAQIHVKNGRRLLMSAKNDLIISSLEIVKIKRNRDRVEEIIDHGNQVLRYFEEEQRMNCALQTNSFTTAVDICIGLRKQLANANLEKLHILKKLTHRVQDFIPELRQQFDRSLRDVAEHFDPLQYKELLHAYITLTEHSENLGFEFSSSSLSDVLANIPDVVVRCIDDLTRQFLAELFTHPQQLVSSSSSSPTHGKSGKRSPRAKKVSKRSPSAQKKAKKRSSGAARKSATSTPARDSAHATLSTAARAIEDVTRGFERLTELMHTYYLLVQWHRDPFNPRNDDAAYLHRCGIDDDDDDDDDDDLTDENEPRSSSDASAAVDKSVGAKLKKLLSPRSKRSSSVSSDHSAGASASSQRSPYSQVLCETGMTLLRYRKIVWENMQQNVMEVLDRMDMTYGFKMEHIIALSHATSTFIEIGEEFTGAATTKLRSCIRTKCEQYLNALHDDNIELMRMLLDTENWQRVVTYLEDGDSDAGLLRVIEKRSGYRFAKKARDEFALNPIYTRRVFPSFVVAGNPFAAANSSAWLSLENGIRFQYETRPMAIVMATEGGKAVAADESESDNQVSPVANDDDDDEPEIVFNSSTLAGFIRFCGVYLKMMEHLPTIAWDILLMLNRIFEFYAYAVFTGFTDRESLLELLRSRGDDDGTDLWRWNGLKHNMCRIAEDMLAGETYVQMSVALCASSLTSSSDVMRARTKPLKDVPMVEKTVTLRRITRVPAALEEAGESNLFALAERCIACEVVCAQVRLLRAIEATARSYLPERYHCLMDELYARNAVVAAELRSFTFRNLATKLVDPPSLLHAVSRVAWDITYMSERPNEYVVALVQKCGEAWGGLQILADGSIPVSARDEIWSAIVQTVMETLLSGFSAVSTCTPQGRALMSMDLHALQNGLDLINHVSTTAVPRGREYVNNYIKAFYYDDTKDLLAWIKDHKDAYTKLQFVNLIRNGVGPKMDRKELRAFVLQVDDILTASP